MERTVKTFEMTFEDRETHILRRRRRHIVICRCDDCDREARMLTHEDAARISGLATRKIFQMIEAGEIHFVETAEGDLLVCIDSLMKEEL
jgi:hypothetical protein